MKDQELLQLIKFIRHDGLYDDRDSEHEVIRKFREAKANSLADYRRKNSITNVSGVGIQKP